MNRVRVFVASMLLCFSLAAGAHAAQVQVDLIIDDIRLTQDDPGFVNPYSVSESGTYSWTMQYDKSLIQYNESDPVHGTLLPGSDPTFVLNAPIGTYNLQISDALFILG